MDEWSDKAFDGNASPLSVSLLSITLSDYLMSKIVDMYPPVNYSPE